MTDHKPSTEADLAIDEAARIECTAIVGKNFQSLPTTDTALLNLMAKINSEIIGSRKDKRVITALQNLLQQTDADIARAVALREAAHESDKDGCSCGAAYKHDYYCTVAIGKRIRAFLTQSAADALKKHDEEVRNEVHRICTEAHCVICTELESVYRKVRELAEELRKESERSNRRWTAGENVIRQGVLARASDKISAILPPAEERRSDDGR